MIHAVADTHAIIWYIHADKRLSATARLVFEAAAVNGKQIAISAITFAEIVYLLEKGRLDPDTLNRLTQAMSDVNPLLVEIPFDRYIAQTMQQIDRLQVPDMPDRMIAATALHLTVPIISKDRKIQLANLNTIW